MLVHGTLSVLRRRSLSAAFLWVLVLSVVGAVGLPASARGAGPRLQKQVPVKDPVPNDEDVATDTDCGTLFDVKRAKKAEQYAAQVLSKGDANRGGSNTIEIPVFWHVIRSRTGQGNVSRAQIAQLMDYLNGVYAPAGFWFSLYNVDVTDEPKGSGWYTATPDTAEELDMKATLYIPDPARHPGVPGQPPTQADQEALDNDGVLNIYSNSPSTPNLGGWSTLAFDRMNGGTRTAPQLDGIVVRYTQVPALDSTAPGRGRVLAHEIGHWLGLYHTFHVDDPTSLQYDSGRCQNGGMTGDRVDDTPAEFAPAQTLTSGCMMTIDSCTMAIPDDPNPGPDSITNIMNYVRLNSCARDFTPGQSTRMRQQVTVFRPHLIGVTP
jgi:hypothetical protein